MILSNNKDKGRAGLSLAIAYFGSNGYTVSIPLNDTQWYDLIIEKDGKFQTVQCKFTATKGKCVCLSSAGGTCGKAYDSIHNHLLLDLLFCADDRMNLFVIPVNDIRAYSNCNQITLRTTPTKNNQGFQTYKYMVKI